MFAKYTVVLKDLIDNPKTKEAIDNALSSYPLYVKSSIETYIPSYIPSREELNTAILNHYKYREIGFDTIGRFLDELEISMNEIMPLYNQLYFSADQDFNIIYNVDYQRTIDTLRKGENASNVTGSDSAKTETSGNASDSSTINSSVNHDSKAVESNTPQGSLTIPAKDIDTVSYADKVNWNKDTNSDSSTTSGSSQTSGLTDTSGSHNVDSTGTHSDEETTLETTKGNFGVVSAQDLVLKYRETIMNITQKIINDVRIQELFMMVY